MLVPNRRSQMPPNPFTVTSTGYAPFSVRFFCFSASSCSVSWLIRAMSLRSVSFRPGVPFPVGGWIEPPVCPAFSRASRRAESSSISLSLSSSFAFRTFRSLSTVSSSPRKRVSSLRASVASSAVGLARPLNCASITRLHSSMCLLYFWIAVSANARAHLCIVPHVVQNFGGAPEFPFLVHDADTVSQHQHHQQTRGQSTVPEERVRGAGVEECLPPPFEHRSIIEVVLVDQLGGCREEVILLLVRSRAFRALVQPRRRLFLVSFVRRA